jgi:hypothetical protein
MARRPVKTRAVIVSVLALFLLGPAVLHAKDDGIVALEVRGERFTLRAVGAPLIAILQQLAEVAGLSFYAEERLDERVSVNLTDVSLEEGVRRVLNRWNTIFLYDKSAQVPSVIYILGRRDGTLPSPTSQPTESFPGVAEAAEDGGVDVEAERQKISTKIEKLEETLRAAPVAEGSEAPTLLQDLLADPEPSVRITALQWFAGKGEAGIQALASALIEKDDLVRRVALQMVLDRGVGEQALEKVMAAAEVEDQRTVRQMLSALLGQ